MYAVKMPNRINHHFVAMMFAAVGYCMKVLFQVTMPSCNDLLDGAAEKWAMGWEACYGST
jgi:hypothetical protein